MTSAVLKQLRQHLVQIKAMLVFEEISEWQHDIAFGKVYDTCSTTLDQLHISVMWRGSGKFSIVANILSNGWNSSSVKLTFFWQNWNFSGLKTTPFLLQWSRNLTTVQKFAYTESSYNSVSSMILRMLPNPDMMPSG